MNTYERIQKLLKSKGLKANNVAKELEFGNSQFTAWKKGSLPSADALIKLANYFHVSVDYLLCRTDNPEVLKNNTEPQHVYSELIKKYAALNAVGQQKVMNYIDDIKDAYAVDSPVHPETSTTTLMSSAG